MTGTDSGCQTAGIRGQAPPHFLAALALGLVAYACSINNGFISDDFVILARLESWVRDFHTFRFPPEGNRLTLYALFAADRALFGLRAGGFYAVAIVLHLVNVWLLGRLFWKLTGRRDVASTAAVAFAVFQNPQEAVMWLAGAGDSLVGLFVLLALHAWLRNRYAWSSAAFALALISKESGLVVLLLVPMVDWARSGRLRFRKEYLALLPPVVAFAALFAWTMRANTYLSGGLYAIGPAGVLTILNSAHRIAFPWLYAAIAAALSWRQFRFTREAGFLVAWIFVTLAPYSFITYQNHVPSRSQYLASMGAAASFALLVGSVPRAGLRVAIVAIFAVVNIGYLWVVKDSQYLKRAASTTRLIEALRAGTPGDVAVSGFPQNPWIAREAATHVPGWRREMIRIGEPCREACPELRWNPATERYDVQTR